ncbi:DUF1579 family protein [Actinomycetospora cinnamomea]|uniref:Uncharacterized protein DUF1579 n=1 Tax=Actinomycetospora cinnamomea TaxID=663609 RepID=A0A2U1EZJ0_9PSEU|nr:DUF1579 family protein [Actinomycetospora cinnamomea]PVZ05354.1 uncharacterized protein DUF1579 [Actinomycetospora cinnamomea]
MTTVQDTVPQPVAVGAEMAALRRFHRDTTWSGTITAGAMGPGSPAMTATGSGTHTLIQDGRWVVGDYRQEQYLLDGTPAVSWQLHWVAGWDPARGEYRATLADCYGHAAVMAGHIAGDRLVFESIGEPAVRLRLTWDLESDGGITWRNEVRVEGGEWSLVEEYRCTPVTDAPAGHSALNDAVRRFNKHALNPLMRYLAGRRHWYASRLGHVGRRSGRAYTTPLVARPVPGGFALPLPYGSDVDWCRNLLAAGRGVLTSDGVSYEVRSPRTVPADEVVGHLTPTWQRLLGGVPEFVVVTAGRAGDEAGSEPGP